MLLPQSQINLHFLQVQSGRLNSLKNIQVDSIHAGGLPPWNRLFAECDSDSVSNRSIDAFCDSFRPT